MKKEAIRLNGGPSNVSLNGVPHKIEWAIVPYRGLTEEERDLLIINIQSMSAFRSYECHNIRWDIPDSRIHRCEWDLPKNEPWLFFDMPPFTITNQLTLAILDSVLGPAVDRTNEKLQYKII